ncbi:MAG: T9SS type A sorting domain-containing protein [Schleiferiaceae bacterium]|nr:T9SS type A sorting domain-containing protein [Schleiferiaceae bacterium]
MKKGYSYVITTLLLLFVNGLWAQSDSLFVVNGTLSSSSTANNSSIANAIDGNLNTSWVSDNPFPSNFFSNAYHNILLDCPLSCNSNVALAAALDGNINTATPTLHPVDGVAEMQVPLTIPKTIHTLGLRLGGMQDNVVLRMYKASGDSIDFVYTTSQNFSNARFVTDVENVILLKLISNGSFYVFEIGALEAPAEEFITLDLGDVYFVKEIKTKHFAGSNNAVETKLLIGEELASLSLVASLNPLAVAYETTVLQDPVAARFIRVSHVLVQENFKKGALFEIEVFAVLPPPAPEPVIWNNDAGLYPSLSANAAVFATSVANPVANDPMLVIDNNFSTGWVSNNPLPDAFAANPDQNVLLGLGGVASGNIAVAQATDGNWGNMTPSIPVDTATQTAWYHLPLPHVPIHRLSVRFRNNFTQPISLIVRSSGSDSIIVTYPVGMSGNQRFVVELLNVVSIDVVASAPFAIQEIAAYSAPLRESVTVDLGEVKEVSWIRTRHFNGTGNALSARLLVGTSLDSLVEVAVLDPSRLDPQNILLPEITPARFVRLENSLIDVNFKKAAVQEITVFDKYGNFGPPPAPVSQEKSFSEIFGVNTVWAWGTNKRLDRQGADEGAQLFRHVAANARNYHNIHWDTDDPDNIPNYDPNNTQVRHQWTRWTQEYADWKSVGFTPNATYTFDRFAESRWDSAYESGFKLGQAFGSVFGPSNENLVEAVEVGNEPWDYSDSTYSLILEGMARGLKESDPQLKVFPCALQAFNEVAGNTGVIKNYIGTKLPQSAAPYLDGVNLHVYSYVRNDSGVRLAVHPEHPESGMRGVFSGIRYRDQNMPGKEVIVTEWGWDSPSSNEFTINSEAVTAIEQAVYALRGLFWLSRMGVSRADWFFYANVPLNPGQQPMNHDRSGLTESLNFNFTKKRSFVAVEAMQNRMGHLYFDAVVSESDAAYIYALRDSTGSQTHLIAWRPVNGNDTSVVLTPLPYELAADSAWYLSGVDAWGEATTVTYESGLLQLPLSSKPLLVQLAAPQSNKKSGLNAHAAVKVCHDSQMASFSLHLSQPVAHLGPVAFANALAIYNQELHWYQESDTTWRTAFMPFAPGKYQSPAVLAEHYIQTNSIDFEIPVLHRLQLSPNPSSGEVNMVIHPMRAAETYLSIWTLDGRMVHDMILPANTTNQHLQLQGLPAGNYILRAVGDDWFEQVKLVKL